jgi:hypothetical protein
VNLTLNIMVGGRVRMAAPYDPANMGETARAIDEQLPVLRQLGRTAIYVNDDNNVAHIIVAG